MGHRRVGRKPPERVVQVHHGFGECDGVVDEVRVL
jgi:hypothetical protein